MNQSAYMKRFYVIAVVGGCLLMIPTWLLIKGVLSSRELVVAVVAWWIVMFVLFLGLFRARKRSVEDMRRKQIASGVPAAALDRDLHTKNIRSMKKFIAMFAVLLAYGIFATRGDPLLPRVTGASVDVLCLVAFIYSLIRSQKKLKELPVDRAPSDKK